MRGSVPLLLYCFPRLARRGPHDNAHYAGFREFGELVKRGLFIYDIQKMRNFICWKREMESEAGS